MFIYSCDCESESESESERVRVRVRTNAFCVQVKILFAIKNVILGPPSIQNISIRSLTLKSCRP